MAHSSGYVLQTKPFVVAVHSFRRRFTDYTDRSVLGWDVRGMRLDVFGSRRLYGKRTQQLYHFAAGFWLRPITYFVISHFVLVQTKRNRNTP